MFGISVNRKDTQYCQMRFDTRECRGTEVPRWTWPPAWGVRVPSRSTKYHDKRLKPPAGGLGPSRSVQHPETRSSYTTIHRTCRGTEVPRGTWPPGWGLWFHPTQKNTVTETVANPVVEPRLHDEPGPPLGGFGFHLGQGTVPNHTESQS